jgi:hypothetical protein
MPNRLSAFHIPASDGIRQQEELSPEQRAELAQQIEAKEFRGKSPSI